MIKKLTFIFIIIFAFSQISFSQIPVLTVTKHKDNKEIYLKSKTVWITLTPFFIVDRSFSPDQGATYIKVGMFGNNLKPYVQKDSTAYSNVKNYKLTRVFGLAQMGVIAPLLAYKHFNTESTSTSTDTNGPTGDANLEEQTGYLTAAIIVFCTGTLTYHIFSKSFLFKTLQRYNALLESDPNFKDVSFNMNISLDTYSQTPQLSLVWTF